MKLLALFCCQFVLLIDPAFKIVIVILVLPCSSPWATVASVSSRLRFSAMLYSLWLALPSSSFAIFFCKSNCWIKDLATRLTIWRKQHVWFTTKNLGRSFTSSLIIQSLFDALSQVIDSICITRWDNWYLFIVQYCWPCPLFQSLLGHWQMQVQGPHQHEAVWYQPILMPHYLWWAHLCYFNDVKNHCKGYTVMLKMCSNHYICMVIWWGPGICCETDLTIMFLW